MSDQSQHLAFFTPLPHFHRVLRHLVGVQQFCVHVHETSVVVLKSRVGVAEQPVKTVIELSDTQVVGQGFFIVHRVQIHNKFETVKIRIRQIT